MEKYLGQSVPKLGFGLMRLPKKDGAIDTAQVGEMADIFLDAGFRYFDTSWGYPGSEDAFKTAVADRHDRSEYLLATKCPVWMAKDREEARNMLSVSLQRTGAGYFDFYLLHNLGESRTKFFDDYDMWSLVLEQKQAGLIRHVGFSFHDKAEALDRLLTAHPEMEFVQLQINYADWENPAVESRKCWETARAHGKSVVIMEPVKGGTLAKLPPDVEAVFRAADPEASLPSWGVRFAASLDGVVTVLSGMSSVEQMRDNVSYMRSFRPLDAGEQETISMARSLLEAYRSIPCTSCRYCMEVCPQPVGIPGIFDAVNMYGMYGDLEAAKGRYRWNTTGHGYKKASECLGCGSCEQACPQHISIRDELKKAADILE